MHGGDGEEVTPGVGRRQLGARIALKAVEYLLTGF